MTLRPTSLKGGAADRVAAASPTRERPPPLLESLLQSPLGWVFVFDRGGRLLRWNRNMLTLALRPAELGLAGVLGVEAGRDLAGEVFTKGNLVMEGPGPGTQADGRTQRLAWLLHHIHGTDLAVAIGLEEPRRKRMEAALEERLRFQHLAASLSARFVNLPAREADQAIAAGLGIIGEFFRLERCTFAEVDPDTCRYQSLHCWVARGIAPPLDPDTRQFMPMLTERIRGGEPFSFRGREEIPHNWVHERRFAGAEGIRAALIVPLKVGGAFLGAFLIDSFTRERDWPNELIEDLRFIGGIFANAVARRRAEELLAGSEKRIRMIANALPHLIAYVGGDRRYRFNNRAYEQWHRIPAEDVHGKTMWEVLGEPIYARVKPYVDQALTGEEVRYQLEVPTGDGRDTRFIEANYVPHLDPAGQVLGFYSLVQDITESKKVEMEVQRQRDQLAQVTRVATLGEMAASMVHELNQPLAAILNNAQAAELFLGEDPPELGEVRDALADIIADDQRAGEVIRRLRAFVVKGDHKTEEVRINDLVDEVLFMMRHDVHLHRFAVTTRLAPDLPAVRGDAVQLQQVLLNLILNGFQAMRTTAGAGGQLTIVTALASEGGIQVSVADSGPGVAPELAERIFDAFFSTRGEGMGMGLSICRTILRAHGGRLWLESPPEGGAVFHFCLPAPEEEPHAI